MTQLTEQKLRGGYYTPNRLADFISSWAIQHKDLSVLEPSCGDGNFIVSSINRFKELGASTDSISKNITGIELIPAEAKKAKERVKAQGVKSTSIINSDFFGYISRYKNKQFDVVLGNPPFIRYQNFPNEHREIAIGMMNDLGLRPNKLTNIWVPFLVIASSKLTDNGKLGMVIPAELFQVKYATETRVFLSTYFQRITIVTFRKLVFDGIQQEVVLLLCEKTVDSAHGIRVVELSSLDDLESFDFNHVNKREVKNLDHAAEKWTKFFLNKNEISLLRKIKGSNKVPFSNELIEVDVGIVTGRNKFFMMTGEQINQWKLSRYTNKVVSKSNHLRGIIFTENDFSNNLDSNYPVYLFLPPSKDFDKQPSSCKKYIKYGEDNNNHTGYKCRIRKHWYVTPSLWNPKGFALRQVHQYPKLILNNTESSATDTIHRVRFISDSYSPSAITICFLNSLTFAFSEITGRSYGGGVLTFEPTEIEDLPIPVVENHGIDINRIDELMRAGEIESILDIVDKAVLIKHYGFSDKEVTKFRTIWKKLSGRRINRKALPKK